jgi:hypothetical protein
MLQCQSTTRCTHEGTVSRDDGIVAARYTRLVPEQAVQGQKEDDPDEAADATGKGKCHWCFDHKAVGLLSRFFFLFLSYLQEGRKMGYGMQGIPMVASSPVRHDSPLNMHGLEVTAYQPPWKALSDFALHADLDNGPINTHTPAFQHLVNQVGLELDTVLYYFWPFFYSLPFLTHHPAISDRRGRVAQRLDKVLRGPVVGDTGPHVAQLDPFAAERRR